MDIEEFEKRVKPSRKRSRLEPFRTQILELKAKDYADWQIREWLLGNGVDVSRQAVQQYVKKLVSSGTVAKPASPVSPSPVAPVATVETAPKPVTAAPSVSTPKEKTEIKSMTPADLAKARKADIDFAALDQPVKKQKPV